MTYFLYCVNLVGLVSHALHDQNMLTHSFCLNSHVTKLETQMQPFHEMKLMVDLKCDYAASDQGFTIVDLIWLLFKGKARCF